MKRKLYLFSGQLCLLLILALITTIGSSKAVLGQGTSAITIPTGFVQETIVSGLDLGIAFDWAPDGRIFIAEKAGTVRVLENGSLLPSPFIDISDQVNNVVDRGLLGIAVHPEFPEMPYVYLLFTYDPPELTATSGPGAPDERGGRVSRLIRVTADANQNYNVAEAGSEVIILGKNSIFENIGEPDKWNGVASCEIDGIPVQDCLPIDAETHTIGTVKFGTDGSLFVSNGDGAAPEFLTGNALRSLDLDSLAGKVLRIHPLNGDAYPDNPFFDGDLTSNRSKVYNYGLRNPFRFTIDSITNEPFIGDVGWSAWEEVNTGRGANFGWPCYEGGDGVSFQQSLYRSLGQCQELYGLGTSVVTPAIYAYQHGTGDSSVQVGDFYRGTTYPAAYQDALFVLDFNLGAVRYITFDNDGNVVSTNNFGTEAGIVQLTAGPDTNLYTINIYNGTLNRIRYTGGGNAPPTAVADSNPYSGLAPLDVSFSSNGSFDPDGDPLTFEWSFGDGATSNQPNPTHTYDSDGTYNVTLTVTDSSGNSGSDYLDIVAGNTAPFAQITAPLPDAVFWIGDTVNFSGTGADTEDGAISGANMEWDVFVHHNDHSHFNYYYGTGSSGSLDYPNHADNTHLELCLTVTDSGGLQDTQCIDLFAETVVYSFDSVPTGLPLSYFGVDYITPFSVATYINAQRNIFAPPEQGNVYFENWSIGGPNSQLITITDTPQSIVANYSGTPPASFGFPTVSVLDNFNRGNGAIGSGWSGKTSGYIISANQMRVSGSGEQDIYWNGGSFGPNQEAFVTLAAIAPSASETGLILKALSNGTILPGMIDVLYVPGSQIVQVWTFATSQSWVKHGADIPVSFAAGDQFGARATETGEVEVYHNGNLLSSRDISSWPYFAGNGHIGLLQYSASGMEIDDFGGGSTVEGNRPPAVTNPGDQNNTVGDAVSLGISATDPDGDPLTFSATGLPADLVININSGEIVGTLAGLSAGSYNVTVTASDGSETGTAAFTWTVSDVGTNRPPSVTDPGDQSNTEGDAVSLIIVASDPDGDTLTFRATGLPAGLDIDPATGEIAGTLTAVSAGIYNVDVFVGDGTDAGSTTFTWTVSDVGTNRPPSVTDPGDQSNTEGDAVSLIVAASDADGDPLTFSATGLPSGLSINASSGEISGTLAGSSAGSYSANVSVSDGAETDSAAFTWTVTAPGNFPTNSVLDNFNRSDGAAGSDWSGKTSGYAISVNQLAVSSSGEQNIYWSGASFGPNQEAFVTLASIDPGANETGLILKSQSSGSSISGLIDVLYVPGSQLVQVWTYASSQSWVQQGADIPVSFANGDQFGARVTETGEVEVYRNGVLLDSRDVSAWPYATAGGYIGLLHYNAAGTELDDFGGGNMP